MSLTWQKYKKKSSVKQSLLHIKQPELDLTSEMKEIFNLIENTDQNIFLTGKAGTGKSTFLQYIRATSKKNLAVLAPTGVAAQNVLGQTIHSFFGFGFRVIPETVKKSSTQATLLKNLDLLIIDEISMVRADLMDCIDKALKINRSSSLPFGGVQLLVIGDLYQLPPVLTREEETEFYGKYDSPYFFDAKSLEKIEFKIFELSKIFRQSDHEFINFLNSLRIGDLEEREFDYAKGFVNKKSAAEDLVYLVSTNRMADLINQNKLEKLSGESQSYTSSTSGIFDQKNTPADEVLNLKIGARVMLLNNDPMKRWMNGDVGEIIGLGKDSVSVKFDSGKRYEISETKWESIKFSFDDNSQKIEPMVMGTFTQLPLRLSWASTIHKSQGKSLRNVYIDLGTGAFAPGQAYVAFSRCRTAEGLHLARELTSKDLIIDQRIINYLRNC